MAVNFKDLLGKNMDKVERPKSFPGGTYRGNLGKFTVGESAKKRTPFVSFPIVLSGPGDDVDLEELSVRGLQDQFGKKTVKKEFYLTPDSEYRLKEFLESLGVPIQGRSYGEALPESAGLEVLVELTEEPLQEGEGFRNQVGNVTGVSQD